ncbi:hypothetical protein LOD99_6700 [Oopsacas minuta]|uniref:Mitogen-activated protein kinase n=1 Tax=Oopsacas minuta TaxID=111878 RepID=A0AAV7JM09_9METZ|nr:hypothetical protein LOD99_6700 [Oopsacas minuta]
MSSAFNKLISDTAADSRAQPITNHSDRPQLRCYKIKHGGKEVTFTVDSRYKPDSSIGMGAYGVVCSALDTVTNKQVAIKKLPDPFSRLASAKRALREINILTHFEHENIICARDFLRLTGRDIYIKLDLMQTDLQQVINTNQLTDEHIKYFSYQMLKALKYIHSGNIVHRDLKPSNILVDENCNIKIGDFSLARDVKSQRPDFVCSRADNTLTEYVATRWYRAPELMMNVGPHTCALDIWSLGCIMAELINGKTLFPGTSYLNELQLILSVTGTPKKPLLERMRQDKVREYIQSLPEQKRTRLSSLFPSAPGECVSLVDKMLLLDPEERCTAETALKHRYLRVHHNPLVEAVCLKHFNFSFEKDFTSPELIKQAALEEIRGFYMRKNKKGNINDTLKILTEVLNQRDFSTSQPPPDRRFKPKRDNSCNRVLSPNPSTHIPSPETKRHKIEPHLRNVNNASSQTSLYLTNQSNSPYYPDDVIQMPQKNTRTIGTQTSPQLERRYDPIYESAPSNSYSMSPAPNYPPYTQEVSHLNSPFLDQTYPEFFPPVDYYEEVPNHEWIDIPYQPSSCNQGYAIGYEISPSINSYIPSNNNSSYFFEPKLPDFPVPPLTNVSSEHSSDCDPTTGQPDILSMPPPTPPQFQMGLQPVPVHIPKDTSNSLLTHWLNSDLAYPQDLPDLEDCCYDVINDLFADIFP